MQDKKIIAEIIASSSGVDVIDRPILQKAAKLIESEMGFGIHYNDKIFDPKSPLYATQDYLRGNMCLSALRNPQNDIVWCWRGGFGANKIADYVVKNLTKDEMKALLIGFSDSTVLHIFMNNCGLRSLYWEGVKQFYDKRYNKIMSREAYGIFNALIHGEKEVVYHNLSPFNSVSYHSAVIRAPVVGGNLSLLTASIGTSWQLQTKGKILLIEDINENYYRIDRMLAHLLSAGMLTDIKGIIIGDISNTSHYGKDQIDYVLELFAETLPVPIFKMPEVGHLTVNYPIPLQSDTEIIVKDKKALLKCHDFFVDLN